MTLARSHCLSMIALGFLATLALAPLPSATAAEDDLAAACARAGDDDTLRAYQPSLKAGAVKVFKMMFPGAKEPPDDAMLAAQAKFRCMDGKVYACLVGANLPCGKLNTSRQNPGAEAFCRTDPDASFVPLAATGHDSVYSYRCRGAKPEVARTSYDLDQRGFAKSLWLPVPPGP
jgi:hypothetical protein